VAHAPAQVRLLRSESSGLPSRKCQSIAELYRGAKEHVLTYRGHEKARDLLDSFDRNHDDMLDFSDFRGFLEHFNR
jgi:hypothetical protein